MSETAHNPDQRVPCGVPACGIIFPIREMANLTDKNGHGWYVCPDCIDKLWKTGHPFLQDDEPSNPVTDLAVRATLALAELAGNVRGILEISQGLSPVERKFLEDAVTDARKVYDIHV